jgi:predicted NUDIX family NTP pyrophosphohydrolase
VRSNTFTMEWPPGSGRTGEFPEVDRAGWFDLETARMKLLRGQLGFIDRLSELLEGDSLE